MSSWANDTPRTLRDAISDVWMDTSLLIQQHLELAIGFSLAQQVHAARKGPEDVGVGSGLADGRERSVVPLAAAEEEERIHW